MFGLNIGPTLYRSSFLSACARISRLKLIRSSGTRISLRAYGGGLVGNGCVGEYHSPGTSPFGTGRSSIGQIGSPVTRLKTYKKACLVGWATALTVLPLIVMS